MEENLLGYLLGALDGSEQEEIRHRLECDPHLREQLAALEARLQPMEEARWQDQADSDESFDVPVGLAARTCALVAQQSSPERQVNRPRTRLSAVTAGWNPSQYGWDLVDMTVAAGIFIAAALLFFPAISNSIHHARLASCQNNLRLNSVALAIFGERNNGVFPYIPTEGNLGVAGAYAPQLMDGGYLTDHSQFLCPSSELAVSHASFVVPSIDSVREAYGQKLAQYQRTMGGSFTYGLGYFERGRHKATGNRGRSYFPVMSDAFQALLPGRRGASGHRNGGVNVAFEGGNVRFVVGASPHHRFFVNDRGLVEAGVNADDAVLGHSWVRPANIASSSNSGLNVINASMIP